MKGNISEILMTAAALMLAAVADMAAQVTAEPTPLLEESTGVTIYFHADEGNKGLQGVKPPEKVYAHTGVITNYSTSASDWRYAPTWGDNSAKYELSYVEENLWKLYIGDIRTYYGITDPSETVERLAFVFRNADNSKEGKGPNNQDIFVFLHNGVSEPAPYPGGEPRMGAVRDGAGTVTFCLAAPGKNSVTLVGSWDDYAVGQQGVMSYDDVDGVRYFWTQVDGLDEGKCYPYYYIVDGNIAVGDPYARLVLDPEYDSYIPAGVFPWLPSYPVGKVHGVPLAVYRSDINDYEWEVKDFRGVDKDRLIIYELLLRDFTGTEGKALGDGTVAGALAKLPYLKQLGVNAIELLPINEFNGNISWGYNPNFYFAPDKAYGTPDDYKRFIDACHKEGIAVILDIVFNQSDWQHPWQRMYQPGENPFFNVTAPHAYSVLNDWNQDYPLVQKQWHDALRYWLEEYRVDGFRFDLVKGLGDNDSYTNSGDAATNAYNASRVARMRELQKVVEEVNPHAYFINENLAQAKEENEMAETGQLNWANVNYSSDQFAMGYRDGAGLRRFYAPYDDRTPYSTVSYMESHDEQRLAYKQDVYGAPGVKGDLAMSMRRLGSCAAQMLMSPGAHMIWQFSELGDNDNTKDATGGNNTDPKTVRWSMLDNPERHGLYDTYRALTAVRNGNPEMFDASASFSGTYGDSDWDNGRLLVSKSGDKELYTVVNPLVDKPLTVSVGFMKSGEGDYQVLASSHETTPRIEVAAGKVTLDAGAFVVIGSKGLSSVDEIGSAGQKAMYGYGAKGRLVIERAGARVDVYTASGVHAGTIEAGEGSLELQSGLYIAVSGEETLKILVR